MYSMRDDIERILVSEKEIEETVTRIAAEIDRDYGESGRSLLLLAILKGSVVFMGDLMKKIRRPVEIDFMRVSSYSGTETRGKVDILLDLHRDDLGGTRRRFFIDVLDHRLAGEHRQGFAGETGAGITCRDDHGALVLIHLSSAAASEAAISSL